MPWSLLLFDWSTFAIHVGCNVYNTSLIVVYPHTQVYQCRSNKLYNYYSRYSKNYNQPLPLPTKPTTMVNLYAKFVVIDAATGQHAT